ALGRMIADAPTEQLAAEYQRLIASIDESLRKLDEVEGRPTTQPGARAVPSSMTSPGTRPLAADPVTEPQRYIEEPPPASNAGGGRLRPRAQRDARGAAVRRHERRHGADRHPGDALGLPLPDLRLQRQDRAGSEGDDHRHRRRREGEGGGARRAGGGEGEEER